MLKRFWDAVSIGASLIASSFASAGDKRPRDTLEDDGGDGAPPPSGFAAFEPSPSYDGARPGYQFQMGPMGLGYYWNGGVEGQAAVQAAKRAQRSNRGDPPSKRQRVREEEPVTRESEPLKATALSRDAASSASPDTSWAVNAHYPPPPGPVFPHGRVDYTTARHVPSTSVTIGSCKSAFSPPGSMTDRKLDAAACDQRQRRIYASLAQFELSSQALSEATGDRLTVPGPVGETVGETLTAPGPAPGPAPGAAEPLGIGFVPPASAVNSFGTQSLDSLHQSAKAQATSGRNAGTEFRIANKERKAAPDLAAEMRLTAASGSRGTLFGPGGSASPDSTVGHSRAQRKAVDKDSLDLYKQALQNMNLVQYDERRRERESRVQQLEAHMLERKQYQDAEAKRGRAAESQRVQMLQNASKIAKREFDEHMAERQRLRREAEAKSKAEAKDVGPSSEVDSDEASSIDDGYSESDDDIDQGTDYPTITDEQKASAEAVMDGDDMEEIIQSKMMGQPQVKIDIKRRDLQCLQPGEWLNDEVINVWMDYVKDRNQRDNETSAGCKPTIYIMKTMFYSRMCVIDGPAGRQDTFDYPGVRRWTKKVDVFAHDMIFIPLHQGLHWALAVVNIRAKRIQYFDSLGGSANTWLQNVKRWIEEESMHKKKEPFDFCGWETLCTEDCPQQHNGFDCGVFMCQFVKHTASHLDPTECCFDQRHMPMIRWQMVHEIITGRVE